MPHFVYAFLIATIKESAATKWYASLSLIHLFSRFTNMRVVSCQRSIIRFTLLAQLFAEKKSNLTKQTHSRSLNIPHILVSLHFLKFCSQIPTAVFNDAKGPNPSHQE
jgi:hypothetical protein